MQKFLLGAIGLAALTGTAFAADMPVKAPAAVVAANWSGVYGGVGVGWMRNNVHWALTNPVPATIQPHTNHLDEVFFSGLLGAQYQFGNIVVGIEASAGTTVPGRFASTTGDPVTGVCVFTAVVACQSMVSNVLTVGGRLGYALNDWLIYGSGGWARASLRSQAFNNTTLTLIDTDQSRYHYGWYAGGGVDYMLLKGGAMDVIVGIDYKHLDLETRYHASSLDAFGPSPPGTSGRNLSATADIVQARVTAKFNPWPR